MTGLMSDTSFNAICYVRVQPGVKLADVLSTWTVKPPRNGSHTGYHLSLLAAVLSTPHTVLRGMSCSVVPDMVLMYVYANISNISCVR